MEERLGRRLKRLVDALGHTANQIHQLRDGDDPRRGLQTSLNEVISQLGKLDEFAGDQTEVPLDLLSSLDLGQHPDLWLRTLMKGLGGAQREALSKAAALKSFHEILSDELGMERPVQRPTKSDDPEEDIIVD